MERSGSNFRGREWQPARPSDLVGFVSKYRRSCGDAQVGSRWLASLLLAVAALLFTVPFAAAETRALKLYFIHTKEKAEIVFKRNGRYDQGGLKQISRLLRDWRRNEPTKMDPRLLDLVWQAYKATGSNEYIHVVSAYRSPATNASLRSRSKGVAKKSQHMLGRAMDFYIPGVKLRRLRDIGLTIQGGGVGYYPSSGSPFVHFDVGNVRHWPRMSRKELVAVFPNGKTLHVPTDGKPLPGFEQALASYKKRGGGAGIALAAAVGDEGSGKKRSGGFLSAFFGGGADEEEESGVAVAAAEPEPAPKPKAQPKPKADTGGGIRILSPDQVRPVDMPAAAEEAPLEAPAKDTPETIIAALPVRDIPLPDFAPRPKADVGAPLVDLDAVARPLVDLEGQATGTTPPAAVAEVAAAEAGAPLPVEPVVASADGSVPLPTSRPKRDDDEVATLLALASTEEPVKVSLGGVPLPSGRPASAEKALEMAALGGEKPLDLPEEGPFPSAPDEILLQPKGELLAALPAQPSGNPGDALGTGVRTTKKAGKPTAKDAKSDPKPVVIVAQPIAARWALDSEYVASNTRSPKAPSYAYNAVRTAPTEVYSQGFQPGDKPLETGRFAGKSVTFMPVARFN
jgi:uncharacterized protein YcbK (DUF882 family)